jgi:peptide/nickel transport system permease protein
MGNTLRGDFGTSFHTQRPVSQDLSDYLPATAELGIAALIVSLVVGIALGVVAAAYRFRWIDYVIRLLAICGISIPVFWLGLIAQFMLYYRLGWFPPGGRLDTGVRPPPHVTGMYTLDSLLAWQPPVLGNALLHLALPAVVLSVGPLSVIARMTRGSMLEVLHRDFIRTARSKGLRERRVIWGHALRNALLPVITVAGLQTGYLLSGAILVETVFSWYGVGLYSVQSVLSSDYNAVVTVTMLLGTIFILLNLVVDVLYAFADPRIRHS